MVERWQAVTKRLKRVAIGKDGHEGTELSPAAKAQAAARAAQVQARQAVERWRELRAALDAKALELEETRRELGEAAQAATASLERTVRTAKEATEAGKGWQTESRAGAMFLAKQAKELDTEAGLLEGEATQAEAAAAEAESAAAAAVEAGAQDVADLQTAAETARRVANASRNSAERARKTAADAKADAQQALSVANMAAAFADEQAATHEVRVGSAQQQLAEFAGELERAQPAPAAAAEPAPVAQPEEEEEEEPKAPFRVVLSTADETLQSFEFDQDVVTVGRDRKCDVHVDNPAVSRRHAEIRRDGDLFALIDLDTPNGTFLNGKEISGLTLLNDGDGVGIGKFRLRFGAKTKAKVGFASPEASAHGSDDLGGMTLQLSPQAAKRVVGEYDRVRGYLLVPGSKKGSELRVQLTETFQIGKDPSCDLQIKGWFAPRKACLISRGMDRCTLVNVSPSPKDVRVNGKQVADRAILKDQDRIEVYGEQLTFVRGKKPD